MVDKNEHESSRNVFRVLSEVDKAHLRPEELLGTVQCVPRSFNIYDGELKKFVSSEFNFSEAFFRLFEEVVTNAIDEFERHGKLNEICVEIDTDNGTIRVVDNGGGYPQEEYEFGNEKRFAPEWILTKLNSGTNFLDDGRITIGMNGCGISLVNFFSSFLKLETSNGSRKYTQEFLNHSKEHTTPEFRSVKSSYTRITFKPDLSLFGLDNSVYSDYMPLYYEYIRNLSVVYPKVKFYFNNKLVRMNKYDFIDGMITEKICKYNGDEADIVLGLSDNKKKMIIVNSKPVNEYYDFDGIVNASFNIAREILNKRLKLNITTNAWFKDNISIVAFFRGTNARFKNQTKDILVRLTFNSLKINSLEYEKWGRRIADNETIASMYSAHFNAKNTVRAEATIKTKKTFIPKLVEATGTDINEKILLIAEGDSAIGQFNSVRNPKIHSMLPLKGKPSNVFGLNISSVVSSDKYMNIINAIGLGDKNNLRHGKCYIVSDADEDGEHIRLLLIQFFAKFFPWFIEEGRLFVLEAPKFSYEIDGRVTYSISNEPPSDAKKVKYYKGLGSMDKNSTKDMLLNPSLIMIEDINMINEFYSNIYEAIG